MDVTTKEPTVVYSISWKSLKEILGENYRDSLISNIVKHNFSCSKYLNEISFTKIENNSNLFKVRYFEKNEKIISKGEIKCSKIIILIQGRIIDVLNKLNKSKSYEIIADKGQILFEKEVYNNIQEEVVNYLIADTDCYIIECKREGLLINSAESFDKNSLIISLKKIPLFLSLTTQKLEFLSNSIKSVRFKDEEVIFSQGEKSYDLYILVSGKINIFIDKNYVRTLNPNEYFGERAVFFNEPRTATAISQGIVTCYSLSRDEFKKVIHIGLKDHLIKRYFLQDDKVQLKDLDYVKDLDKRKYGFVSLVINRNTGFPYAIKIISKKLIQNENFLKNVEAERELLLQIDHPFIIKLVKTLKDSKNVYLLKEYINGEPLYDVIRNIGILNNFQSIEYLHERNYLYRNIKPENVIVNEKGFIKLIEFGFSKRIQERTNTILGTPHYMAPEIILGEPYCFSVDVWSIAVCIYEFKCGELPFGETMENPMDVYLAIINEKLAFPSFIKDESFISLLERMLCKNPSSRLHRLCEVKIHDWLADFPWEELGDLNIEAPYIPNVRKEELRKVKSFEEYLINIYSMHSAKAVKNKNIYNVEIDEFYKNF